MMESVILLGAFELASVFAVTKLYLAKLVEEV